jgi:aspartate carbamoyltransferase catalytic subunit
MHSRVARSNIVCLLTLGARVRICAPATLMPDGLESIGIEVFTDLNSALLGSDVIMALRLQNERMAGGHVPSIREYHALYGLTTERVKLANADVLVMHPGPMNRGVEIDSEVADDPMRSAITEQVEMGVAVRMACLDVLTRTARGAKDWA